MGKKAKANYAVTYLRRAADEARSILSDPKQYLFCVGQAKLLRFFPESTGKWQGRFFNLDIKKLRGESYWELRIWDKILEHRNVRIMFKPFRQPKVIVVLCVYQKQTEETPDYVKVRCRRRVRALLEQGYRP